MDIGTLVSLAINGLAMGMIYAMIAMGLILLIRAVGVMNFAQGDLLMFGAYIAWWLFVDLELPIYLMIPASLICYAVIAIVFMLTAYWPLRNATYPAATVISTMGAAITLKELATIFWGSYPKMMPAIMKKPNGKAAVIKIGKITLQWQFVLCIIVGIVLIYLVFTLFEKMYVGRIMQAAAQDKYAAELIGIPTILTTAATYIIVVTLCSIAGTMVSPIFTITNTLGTIQLRAFAGVVIGGFGNIKGAIFGSLLVGLIESYSTIQFSQYKDAVVFLTLIVFLLIRPQGIFGEKIAEKG